jgi:hypothetical protein
MKAPDAMSLDEIRSELRQMGVTPRFMSLILRELGAVEARIRSAARHGDEQTEQEVMKAHLNVLHAYGMAKRDRTLNRKGNLFVALASGELKQEQGDLA